MKKMLSGFVMVMALCLFYVNPATAQWEGDLPPTTGTLIRGDTVLTTSNVLSTTFTLGARVKAVHFYVDYTKGSLTNATFTPAGARYGNPDATDYYASLDKVTTVTETGKYHIRVARNDFGASDYVGLLVKGSGTAAGSKAVTYAKFEY